MNLPAELVLALCSIWVLVLCAAAWFAKTPLGMRIATFLRIDPDDPNSNEQ